MSACWAEEDASDSLDYFIKFAQMIESIGVTQT